VPSFAEMVDEVVGHLQSWTLEQERMCSLAADLPIGSFQLTVDDATVLGQGLFEVDEELVRINVADAGKASAVIPQWGRGQQGTQIANHTAGARVTRAPRFPRARTKRILNEVIGSLNPMLFAVKTDESLVSDSTTISYPLPADVLDVLDVKWLVPGGFEYWDGLRSWRVDRRADTSNFPTGVSIDLPEPMAPGQRIKVVYSAKPGQLADDTDDFATVTGFADSVSDIPCLLAAARMATGADLAATHPSSVEQSQRAQLVQPNSGQNISKYLYALAQDRLQQERDRLFEQYPIKVRETW